MEETSTTDTSTATLFELGFDPFSYFSTDTFSFLIIPLAFVLILFTLFSIVILVKRSRNRRQLEQDIVNIDKASSNIDSIELHEQITSDEVEGQKDPDLQHSTAETSPPVNWLTRFRSSLSKTSTALRQGLLDIVGAKASISDSLLESVHEVLFRADMGVKTADHLVNSLKVKLRERDSFDFEDLQLVLQKEISTILRPCQKEIELAEGVPTVILVVGVNGVGKTTTIGKLAHHFIDQGKTVLLGAADTFRAAAIEQLQEWGTRNQIEVIAHKAGSDPAAVAYDSTKAALARKVDVLIIDTAGRLHNKSELMEELAKIRRVISKDIPSAPQHTLLVIDATTGQNAHHQVKAFRQVVQVSGLVITKLDGTAKGGVIVGIAKEEGIPIHFVGLGEQKTDLRPFDAAIFAESLIPQ